MTTPTDPSHDVRNASFECSGQASAAGKKITAGYNGPPPSPANEARPTSPPPPKKEK